MDSSESSNEDLDLPDRCRLVKLANSVTYDRYVGTQLLVAIYHLTMNSRCRMDKALDQLEKISISGAANVGLPATHYVKSSADCTQSGDKFLPELTQLVRVLLGMSEISKRVPVAGIEYFDSTLNQSQKDAVRFALESPEVACIHGPPGSLTFSPISSLRELIDI